MKKYELTDETMFYCGRTLHRIRALCRFSNVRAGDRGGWVESESNLSQDIDNYSWVEDDAKVYGGARVFDDARVYGDSEVFENAMVHGSAHVSGRAWVFGNAHVSGSVDIFGDARVGDCAFLIGDADIASSKDYAVYISMYPAHMVRTYTKSNKKWSNRDFYGSGKELIKHERNYGWLFAKQCEIIVMAQEAMDKAIESEENGHE